MKFSVQWLREWVKLDVDADQLAATLTASGLEVDTVKPVAAAFDGVVVAEIIDSGPHPNADKLSLCRVSTGADDENEPLQIVCGAPNVRAGLRVALAQVGARIGDDVQVQQASIRDLDSAGMLCSGRELGLSDEHAGILELPADAPLGKDLREYLSLDDATIALELTPDRADCLSIRGLAQDVAASCKADHQPLDVPAVAAVIEDSLAITLQDPADCPRFAGRVIKGVDVTAETPLWMMEKLRRCGVRSISVVVDVTNYVMLEQGQPMHAFDLARLDGEIIVRRGRKGEKLTLLDEQEIQLEPEAVVVCDASGPVALAGIMGGLASSVTDATQDIFFEAAFWSPPTIMGRARDYGLHTDASHRFERGVDPVGQVRAIERATALLLEIAGGAPGPVIVAEESAYLPVNQPVSLRIERLTKVLGAPIDVDVARDILTRLGMMFVGEAGATDVLTVVAPPARFDIAIEEDLIEEVARIYGYDNLPATPPSGEVKASAQAEAMVAVDLVRQALCASGYQEVINYSFVDLSLLAAVHHDEMVLPLSNPLSAEMAVMRTALLPGLLTNLAHNVRRQHSRVRLFETGRAYLQGETLAEKDRVAAVASGSALPESWAQSTREMDFYDIKSDVERLMELRGPGSAMPDFEAADLPWIHPGSGAVVRNGGQVVGWCGAVHPSVLKSLKIRENVYFLELELDYLLQREIPFAKLYSRFPSIRRDLALMLPVDVTYDEVRKCVIDSASQILENLLVFDVYKGKNLKKGYKSLAIGLILQNVSSTLSDEDVDQVIHRVVDQLEQRLGAQLRG